MITVVTAPSRSGTSLTIQMLLNAGVPVLWNCLPNRTVINPRGHYEMMAENLTAFVNAVGPQEQAVVKVMPWHLERLPPRGYQYIVIVRDIDSIQASHDAARDHHDWRLHDTEDIRYWQQFALDEAVFHRHVIVKFDELFTGAGVDIIGDMMGLTPLQRSKMRDTVDPALRHHR